jgi:hypothetical protein
MICKISHRILPLLAGILLAASPSLSAQSEAPAEEPVLLYNISYSLQFPAGELSERFGRNSTIGMEVEFITPSNWIIGGGGYFMFGNFVNENVLANLYNADTILYAEQGEPAFLALRERGFYAGLHTGKLVQLPVRKARAGIRFTLGGGLLQHKIRLQEDPQAFVPQIAGDYKKGYDRLTNGFALNQQIGFQFLSRNERINFYLAFEATQGFTRNRRDWNIDTQMTDTANRLDLLFGIRLNWSLPFYKFGTGESRNY